MRHTRPPNLLESSACRLSPHQNRVHPLRRPSLLRTTLVRATATTFLWTPLNGHHHRSTILGARTRVPPKNGPLRRKLLATSGVLRSAQMSKPPTGPTKQKRVFQSDTSLALSVLLASLNRRRQRMWRELVLSAWTTVLVAKPCINWSNWLVRVHAFVSGCIDGTVGKFVDLSLPLRLP